MKTLLGMQYGGAVQQQYPRRELQLQPQPFQEGGNVSSGLAALLREQKKREASDEADRSQREEVKKQKRSGLFGSIGGLGGGLLGSAALGALGFTPAGIPLALAAGLGTGLGKAFGSKVGYEGEWSPGVMFRKAKSEKAKDIMYGKEAGLEDIERASRDNTAGIDTAAGLSGLKAGLTAGFSPSGGIYGKAGKWGQKASAGFGAPGAAIQSSLGLSEAPTSLTGGAPTLQLPQARTAIAGTESGLTGLTGRIPETLGNIPSVPSAISDAGAGALLEGGAEALLGGAGSFGQAFANAREAGKEIFEWNGKMYNTVLAQSGGMIKQNPQSLLGYLG